MGSGMARREHIRMALDFLASMGLHGEVDRQATSSGHFKIRWIRDGRAYLVTASCSPKNRCNAGKELCREIRKTMSEERISA